LRLNRICAKTGFTKIIAKAAGNSQSNAMNNGSNRESRLNLTADSVFKRLRWVMVGAMLFSMFNTLAGQPARFWINPEQAIRGDGLGLHNSVNHTFEFFLSRGWQPYALSCLIYLALAFVAVSILPRKAALIAGLSIIFGHYYGGSNWLAVRWHLGFTGAGLYALLLSVAMAWVASPIPGLTGDQIIRRLRWVMIGVMLMDPFLTLLGQPASYWAHPETVLEGNPFWRSFMVHGWGAYVGMDLLYCLGAFWLASAVPRFYAVMTIFGFTFGHFLGGSSWFFYVWRMGMEMPVIYGIVISSIIVFVSFRRVEESKSMVKQSSAAQNAYRAVCCSPGS
jgi:hypothetical protein